MNEKSCSAFENGTRCGGVPHSEMCSKCPCFSKEGALPVFVSQGNQFYAEQKLRTKKASDTQVGGNHYTDMGIQPLEFTYANYGYIGLKAAIHTKVNKYLGRVKDNEVEQLKKARHCIDLLIEKAEQQ